jgi:hypothetical protein
VYPEAPRSRLASTRAKSLRTEPALF